jgi:DNA-binding phage protein
MKAMLPHPRRKSTKKRRVVRFAGICAAARELGVTRIHLYRVLTKERRSPGLMTRYRALKRNGALA